MTSVLVGVHVHAEPARLAATLQALERPYQRKLDLLLLPDGPDRETAAAIDRLGLRCSATTRPLGPPSCFNRLAAERSADIVILLESGAVPAPGAVDRLVGALRSGAGLAGPSTNRAWNEQCAFPHGDDIVRTGREAARRFGAATRPLEPLHGLADFCLAVRRDVIDTIGGADEGYGLGPCWEMEYCVRAVRAGFRAVWAQGAYVWRAPFTARRAREEARLFETSKRRYQDSVCGLRLRGERGAYQPHCRGDACEHFAPGGLIQIRRPLPARERPATASRGELPLVSCVMPTRNRADFALQAVRLFQRQDYESRELLIVDDGDDDLASRLPDDPRIRYIRAQRGESIGAKRNRACAAAHGAFVAQWDDDDWYGRRRLSAQLAPLLEGRADITGLSTPLFFELPEWRFWTVTPALHARLFVGDVHGGTLTFARQVWERHSHYPNASLAEDAAFLARARSRGARLERVDGTGHFVYLRHARNAWHFACGRHVDPAGWGQAVEPPFPPEDRRFYAERSPASAVAPPRPPLVSCVMPTADRRAWVAQSIEYFLRQDYAARELLVLDDGSDRVADLIPSDSRIRYVPLDRRLVLGEKRNVACQHAGGDLIAHWDDDDWYAPNRLTYQVGELERHGAAICGSDRILYFEPAAQRAWLYEYPPGPRRWIAGLCYRRELWEQNQFARVQVGEDTRFVWGRPASAPLVLPEHRFFVGVVHGTNTSRKSTGGSWWQPRPLEEVRRLLGADFAFYDSVR